MSNLSIRLPDKILHEIETYCGELNMTRNEYIRRSIEHMNREMYRQKMRVRLKTLSKRVREESQLINDELERVAYVIQD